MRRSCLCGTLAAFLTLVPVGVASDDTETPDLSRVGDAGLWRLLNATAEPMTEDGKTVVRLKPKAPSAKGSNVGLAVVEGLEFGAGTLELDVKGKGKSAASFVGVAFNVRDERTFEAVYFRPFNFRSEDPSRRVHAVQYVAWPEHTWEKLRAGKPGRYEQAVRPVPDPADWFHVRVEVTQEKVRVWVADAKEPCLAVDRLARGKGKVGLWVDSQEGSFRAWKITSPK